MNEMIEECGYLCKTLMVKFLDIMSKL